MLVATNLTKEYQSGTNRLIAQATPVVFVLLWCTGFIGTKYVLTGAEPMTYLTVRMALAVAIMGAGAGMAGTARAQYDLRRCCVFLDMHPLNKPEVLIGQAQTKFDAEGRFTDEVGRGLIRDLLVALEQWTWQIAHKN